MDAALLGALVKTALGILTMYFEHNKDKKEQREAFLKFVEKMQSGPNNSADIRNSYKEQIERLKKIGVPNGP